jgi:hypothetical protein
LSANGETTIYQIGEEKEIKLNEDLIGVFKTKAVDVKTMSTLLICLKIKKVIVPKPLRINIFNYHENIFLVGKSHLFLFENQSISSQIPHLIKEARKSTILYSSPLTFSILSICDEKEIFVIEILFKFFFYF